MEGKGKMEKLQKIMSKQNTWNQESRMYVVKKTGYLQYHHHIFWFVTISTDFAKGGMILKFLRCKFKFSTSI